MIWTATAHTIDRPAWMAHAMMWALQRGSRCSGVLCDRSFESLVDVLLDERSRVQA